MCYGENTGLMNRGNMMWTSVPAVMKTWEKVTPCLCLENPVRSRWIGSLLITLLVMITVSTWGSA